MSQLWVPGMPGGGQGAPSVEDFLKRIVDQIQQFSVDCECDSVQVEVLLHDGRRLKLHSITPEPGFGWVTLRPFNTEGSEEETDDGPDKQLLLVPLQSIVRFIIGPAEEEHKFGFVPPDLSADTDDD